MGKTMANKSLSQSGLTYEESFVLMGTTVSIRVVGRETIYTMSQSIRRALSAMQAVEMACSRFDSQSALRHLMRHPGELIEVPPALFYALQIAQQMSELTHGMFDPTVGNSMERFGFNRHYVTQEVVSSEVLLETPVSYHDIMLVEETSAVMLKKPMVIDLGGVAKGLAVDMARKELEGWDGFAINAGGDVYVQGVDPHGEPWDIGVEHPKEAMGYIATLRGTNIAVATSGSYRQRSPIQSDVHHLWNPVTMQSPQDIVSLTVIAPWAVLADAAATAAFLLGSSHALSFIDDLGLAGLMVKDNLSVVETTSMKQYRLSTTPACRQEPVTTQ